MFSYIQQSNAVSFHKILIGNARLTVLSDRLYDDTGGNKAWKMRHIINQIQKSSYTSLVTVGGAYSNSVLAVCAFASGLGLKPVVLVRGEELALRPLNPLLMKAVEKYGALLRFISRKTYRNLNTRQNILEKTANETNGYIIQEGVSGFDGYLGVKTFFSGLRLDSFKIICIPCATGTTLAGILSATTGTGIKIMAFPVVHALPQIKETVNVCLKKDGLDYSEELSNRVRFIESYIFGGFAKRNVNLMNFIENFRQQFNIPLDYRYTGKMMYGIQQEILAGNFYDDGILCIHTGGLYRQ